MLSTVVLRDPDRRCWFTYTDPLAVIATDVHTEVSTALAEVEHRVQAEQIYAAGFVSYAAASGFDAALPEQTSAGLPLLCFGLFAERKRLDTLERVAEQAASDQASWQWRLAVSADEYRAKVQQLRRHIARGDTYQVNLTDRLQSPGCLSAADFVRIAADAPYGAYLDGEQFTIVSASPELFFEQNGQRLRCRPMKGTVRRGLDSATDEQAAAWLRASPKNRAENLMITDMVRNDLGRIAQPGSVQTSALFDVEQYPTVWQMTSTVEAVANTDTAAVFSALFPGASITGAPKRAAMQIINRQEKQPRDIYTGSIGVMEPTGLRRFNIAIRTAWTEKRSNTTFYGAGGGIVWDSDADDEYAELLAKTQVLYTQPRCFQLLETMRWQPGLGIYLRQRHLARLAASAKYFQFDVAIADVEQQLDAALDGLQQHPSQPPPPQKVRLLLARDGRCEIATTALADVGEGGQTPAQPLQLATTAVDTDNVFLYHKTTLRDVYANAADEVPAGFEPLLFNRQGYVTETSIANVVYQLGGEHFTPPVADGLLPGTLRAELIQQGVIRERSLPLGETAKVEAWHLINALRGWRSAELEVKSEGSQGLQQPSGSQAEAWAEGNETRVQDVLFSRRRAGE